MMRKIFRPLIALSIIAAFASFSVFCCCTTSALIAHLHKSAICGHCQNQDSHGKSSSPAGSCEKQLTSADISHGPSITSSVVSGSSLHVSLLSINHQSAFTHSLLLAYPPGGPPLGISFIPLYLRTFNLRV